MATATQYGANYTIADNVTPATQLDSPKWGGKVRCVEDILTASQTCDAGSILYVGKLPKGAIPIAAILASDTTNAITGLIGWTGDTNAVGQFSTLANTLTTGNPVMAVSDVGNTKLTAEKDVFITTAGAGLESGKKVYSKLLYAVE